MKPNMENTIFVICVVFASFIFTEVSCRSERRESNYQRSSSNYDSGVLCDMSATKRMLKSIGIASIDGCLLKNKRDMANLVSAYLRNDVRRTKPLSTLNRRKDFEYYKHNDRESKADIADRTRENMNEDLAGIMEDFLNKRKNKEDKRGAGNYCCSPDCDPFMNTLSWPNPQLITCEE